jgi:tetratricopeptide (TPR) repeat protein
MPKDVLPLFNRGTLHERKGELDAAIADYSRAIALDPRDFRPIGARCWLRAKANIDLDQAVPDCDRALELAPGEWNNYNDRGFLFFRRGRYAEAVRDLDKAIELNPGSASNWYMRGLARRAKGDEGGRDDQARALEIDPGIAERFRGYGVVVD